MQTLGIDLAAGARDTAVCTVTWGKKRARVEAVATGREAADQTDDAGLVGAMAGVDRVGIDVPFGWPSAFVDAVARHDEGKRWRGEDRDALRFRETDRHVREHVPTILPLSVSTEKLGVTALRAAALLDEMAVRGVPIDRSGIAGPIAEVYPAAALRRWIGRRCFYKGPAPKDDRQALLDQLVAGIGDAFRMDPDIRAQCVASDHAFDAFVSALVARAVARGQTDLPRKKQRALARREGWIHVPAEGSLATLS
jgi:predicted nuclease with RNAse H fold